METTIILGIYLFIGLILGVFYGVYFYDESSLIDPPPFILAFFWPFFLSLQIVFLFSVIYEHIINNLKEKLNP